jgi:hypothetical protein
MHYTISKQLQLKVQHSGALNDNNSVKIALPHLQALLATLKYSNTTPAVRKRHQIIENPVPGGSRRHSKHSNGCSSGEDSVFFNGRQGLPPASVITPGSPLPTRGGGPVDTGAAGPVARWGDGTGDQTEVLSGRVVRIDLFCSCYILPLARQPPPPPSPPAQVVCAAPGAGIAAPYFGTDRISQLEAHIHSACTHVCTTCHTTACRKRFLRQLR